MAGAENAAHQDEDPLEQDCPLRHLPRHEPKGHQEITGDGRSEELEGPLHPQVDNPPSPEIGDGERRLYPGERDHPERVDRRDAGGAVPEKMFGPEQAEE
jgi:hypothetical protein